MKTAPLAQATAVLLAAVLGAAHAQTAPAPSPKVLTDAAPLPAEDRASTGAIVLEESPPLAKQGLVQETVARNRQMMTSVMGAGPAPTAEKPARVIEIRDGKVWFVPAK